MFQLLWVRNHKDQYRRSHPDIETINWKVETHIFVCPINFNIIRGGVLNWKFRNSTSDFCDNNRHLVLIPPLRFIKFVPPRPPSTLLPKFKTKTNIVGPTALSRFPENYRPSRFRDRFVCFCYFVERGCSFQASTGTGAQLHNAHHNTRTLSL